MDVEPPAVEAGDQMEYYIKPEEPETDFTGSQNPKN